ncbi:hypothetical protein RSSM_01128 [Rhodopirellula sallentina SM41]|uniref:Uncharacterized protein n=1 Tax=Rhodopirellula sallentina SM41 TaxID=1263870 RepID=M5UHV0_9BACT|nr:hypothetical protein RSSM_01128 [Rhodopirellula sallentina SM41]
MTRRTSRFCLDTVHSRHGFAMNDSGFMFERFHLSAVDLWYTAAFRQ